jgi:nucleoside-diphosphate-sugar epimerase/quercetin dioxygenase-like cupin family protein
VRILITGGAGYLGMVLASELLGAGHEVRVVDSLVHGAAPLLALLGRERFSFAREDVRDAAAMAGALRGIDGVVHLAAIVGDPACARQPDLARAVNTAAAIALADAAVAAGVPRFVFASTCSGYGAMDRDGDLLTEGHPLRPLSVYAASKVAVERHLLSRPPGPTALTPIRLATLYGLSPRMRFDLTVNEVTRDLVVRGRALVRGARRSRPYVHVRDAARAIALVLAAPPGAVAGEALNVGATDENYRKIELCEAIRGVVGGELEVSDATDDPRDYRVSFELLRRRLGFEITRRVPDGAREIAGAITAGVLGDTGDDREGAGPMLDRCNLGALRLERVRAHGGEGEIGLARVASQGALAGACAFIDLAVLPPGTSIGRHRHAVTDEELYLVLGGEGEMWRDGEVFRVGSGDLVRNPPGARHGLVNVGRDDLRVFVFDLAVP